MAKVMISIPDDDLARIDHEAARRGTSRSALLREAALGELDRPRAGRVREALRRGQQLLAGIELVDTTAMIRHDRGYARRSPAVTRGRMTAALCDTNVVVKWFHDEPGDETPAARRIAGASEDGDAELKVLDLTYYELGDTVRRLGASGAVVAGVLAALHEVCGPGIATDRHHWAAVADVADQDGLSFSDAAYVAIADRHDLTLLTADEAMIKAGGVLPSTYVETLSTP